MYPKVGWAISKMSGRSAAANRDFFWAKRETSRTATALGLPRQTSVTIPSNLALATHSERTQRETIRKYSLPESLYDRKGWLLTLACVANDVSSRTLWMFMSLIVRGLGLSPGMVGVVNGIPYRFALVSVNYCGWHSDKTGLRTWHLAGSWFVVAARDFSYVHGGSVRTQTRSRYRQWMTRKLAHWWDQFGTSGCVGCGRCIA
jgi:hypothetical protein